MDTTLTELEQQWRSWILENEGIDPATLALKLSGKKEMPASFLVSQVKGRQIAKYKMPSWYNTTGLIYPDTLILEQCSSESTANYKESLVNADRIADLTGGLGIDASAFARRAKKMFYCEPNADRCAAAEHNFTHLGLKNCEVLQKNAEQAVELLKDKNLDLVFIDPSRRTSTKQKVFRIEDLQPDVLQLKEKMLQIAPTVMVKFSPMLDIADGLRQLPETSHVHIVSWKGECRELLFILKRENKISKPRITCIELDEEFPAFDFISSENTGTPELSFPLHYLYEPTASVSKGGAWKALSEKFNVKALHTNTHLFTSNERVAFPGRCFEVVEVLPYDAKIILSKLPAERAQLVFRNFPVPAKEVMNKLKIPSAEPYYLFFVTTQSGEAKVVLSKRI